MTAQDLQELAVRYGDLIYVGTFVWTFVEGETFVIFLGLAARLGYLDWTTLFVAAWTGSFCGDQLYFWVGRTWGAQLLARFPRARAPVEVALDMMRRYDAWFILSFRFVYGVRNVASFAIGASGVHPLRFAALNFVAAGAWALSYAGFGYLFGLALEPFLDDLTLWFGLIMLGMFAIAVATAIYMQKRRMRERTLARARARRPAA